MFASFFANVFTKHLGKVIIGVLIITAFVYFSWSQKEIKTLKDNQSVLEFTVKEQNKTIEMFQEDFENAANQLKLIIKNNDRYYKEIQALINKFHKNGRSLRNLANKKPKLVENAINNGTEEYLRCIEKITKGEECGI